MWNGEGLRRQPRAAANRKRARALLQRLDAAGVLSRREASVP
jgi:hypothetical protein